MNPDPFEQKNKMLELHQQLKEAEEERLAGRKGYTIEELDGILKDLVLGKSTEQID